MNRILFSLMLFVTSSLFFSLCIKHHFIKEASSAILSRWFLSFMMLDNYEICSQCYAKVLAQSRCSIKQNKATWKEFDRLERHSFEAVDKVKDGFSVEESKNWGIIGKITRGR